MFVESLIELLQIKIETSQREAKIMSFIEYAFITCLSDVKQFKLREVLTAYEMALNGKLTLENKQIEIYPELSNITFSKIIQALKIYKQTDVEYLDAKSKLLALKSAEVLEQEKQAEKEIILKCIEQYHSEVKALGYSKALHTIFDKLFQENKITVTEQEYFKIYDQNANKLKNELSVLMNEKKNKTNAVVFRSYFESYKNQVKDINENRSARVHELTKAKFASDYVKDSNITFDELKRLYFLSYQKTESDLKENMQEFNAAGTIVMINNRFYLIENAIQM